MLCPMSGDDTPLSQGLTGITEMYLPFITCESPYFSRGENVKSLYLKKGGITAHSDKRLKMSENRDRGEIMAIIEMIQSHYTTPAAVRKIINYILNPEKTSPEIRGGVFCSPSTATQEFQLTKAIFKKEKGRQVIHFTQAFAPTDNVTPAMAKEIADKLLTHASFKGFQVVYAVHTDKSHIHTHFVVNTVNYETGKKWQQTSKDLKSLKEYSDKLCRDYGLSVVDKEQDRQMNRGAYRAKQKDNSYVYETTLAVKLALAHSDSKESFMANIKKLGYKVEWFSGQKNIVFTTPDGQKVWDRSLYPKNHFNKESMTEILAKNTVTAQDRQDFEKIVLEAEKIRKEKASYSQYPLTFLKKQEEERVFRHDLQMECMVTASEIFLELALNEQEASGSGAEQGKKTTLAELKNYLAERKKGQGLDFEHEGSLER